MKGIVNIRGRPSDKRILPGEIYIGRYAPGIGSSKWGNPYKIEGDVSRDIAIAKYRTYILDNKSLLASLNELVGKVGACYCAPEPCHGDVLRHLVQVIVLGNPYPTIRPKGRAYCRAMRSLRSISDKRDTPQYLFNVCSTSKDFTVELSPFRLGPIRIDAVEGVTSSLNLENYWQSLKVYVDEVDEHPPSSRDPPSAPSAPSSRWFDIHRSMCNDKKPHRHKPKSGVEPATRRSGEKPLYAFYRGEHLNYDQARRRIYCPIYAKYVVKTDAYKRLADMIDRGHNLVLLDFDGRDYTDPVAELNDLSRPFGHGIVLCCLLNNTRVWEWENIDGMIVDKEGYRAIIECNDT